MTTYSQLKQDLINLFEDDYVEFTEYLPTAVTLAHYKLDQDFDTFNRKVTVSTNTSLSTYTLPEDYLYLYDIFFNNVPLERKTDSYVRDYLSSGSVVGAPKYYFMPDNTQIMMAPAPTTTGELVVSYEAATTPISDSLATNFYSLKMYNVLFHCVAMYMANFLQSDTEYALQKEAYTQALSSLGVRSKQEQQDAGTINKKPKGQTKDGVVQGA